MFSQKVIKVLVFVLLIFVDIVTCQGGGGGGAIEGGKGAWGPISFDIQIRPQQVNFPQQPRRTTATRPNYWWNG